MKKISLIATLFFGILLLENCKKDTVTAIATSNSPLIATIIDTTWTPKADSITADITYSSATGNKVFTIVGTSDNKRINLLVTKKAANTDGFPLETFNVDGTTNVVMSYEFLQKDASGNYVFLPQGIVQPGSGTLVVTAIDSVKKRITGTFSFTSKNYNPVDSAYTVAQISSGAFNGMKYTFISN